MEASQAADSTDKPVDNTKEQLDTIIKKIVSKAEFLIQLQIPQVLFKSTEFKDLEEPGLLKKPSYIPKSKSTSESTSTSDWKQSVKTWHDEIYDFGRLKTSQEIASQIKEASTESVLGLLQCTI